MIRTAVLAVAILLAVAANPAQAQFNAFKDPVQGGSSGAASGPDLQAVADKVEGGRVTVGATAYVIATFKNGGSSPVKVTGVNLYPSSTVSAVVTGNKCADADLPPEAQCAVTIAVTGLVVGPWRVELLLDHDGRTRLATAALSGQVEASGDRATNEISADIDATPAALDFGSATGSTSLVRSVLFRNRTSEAVEIGSIVLDASAQAGLSLKSECPSKLQPGETCVVNVTWLPSTRGAAQGILRLNHNAKSKLTKVDVSGTFDPAAVSAATIYPEAMPNMGILVSDMDKVDFGTGIDSVSAITLTLVNVGSVDLALKSIHLAGSDNGLSVSRTGCAAGLVLKPVDACALTINWVPSRAGNVIDDLQIMHTGARGVLILPIRGGADAAASRESIAVRQPGIDMKDLTTERGKAKEGSDKPPSAGKTPPDKPGEESLLEDILGGSTAAPALTPVLDGYTVTSHSSNKAIINGPIGSLVVRDGEDVVISGVRWTVSIVSTGVVLDSGTDQILLVFDKSLRPLSNQATDSSTQSSTTNTNTNTNTNNNNSNTNNNSTNTPTGTTSTTR